MGRVFLFGAACSVLAFFIIMSGQLLNFDLQNVLLGLALGAATGLVRTHSPLVRISAFLIGFALGMAFYVLRLAVFPSTWLGNALAVVLVLMLMTTISALTRDRLPLWAMFIGNAAFAGAYNGYFSATPWLFETQSIQVAAAMLFSSGAGFLVCILVEIRVARGGVNPTDPMKPARPEPPAGSAVDSPVGTGEPIPAGVGASSSAGLSVLNQTQSKEA